MYDMREAMAYTGHLPAQQPQAQQQGITPQLLDLLAMQKVDADKKAAAQAMALQSGQTPPTVADSLHQQALQGARQEIAQKLGLGGLMQKMQAQQGPTPGAPGPAAPPGGPQGAPAPAGQPNGPVVLPQGGPQGAPQGMAVGGLAYLPSNLPKSYASGGIIAFDEGGQTDDPNVVDLSQFQYAPDDTINDKARKDALRQQYINAQAAAQQQRADAAHSRLSGGLSSAWGSIKDALGIRPDNGNYANEARGQAAPTTSYTGTQLSPDGLQQLQAKAQTGDPDAKDALAKYAQKFGAQPNAPAPSNGGVAAAQPASNAAPSGGDQSSPAPNGPATYTGTQLDADTLKKMQIRAQNGDPQAQDMLRAYSQKFGGLQGLVWQDTNNAQGTRTQTQSATDPYTSTRDALIKSVGDTLGKSRTDVTNEQDAMYNKYMAPGLAGIIANKQAALDQLKELQAKQVAARPSDFMRALQLVGQNVHSHTPGIGGAFEGVSTGMDATHQAYIGQEMTNLQNRQALLNDIAQAQQTNDIGRYTGAVAALKEHDASVNAAQATGKGLLENQNTVEGRLEAARERIANKPSGNEKAISDAEAAFARDPSARNIQKQIDARRQPGYLQMNPNEPTEDMLNAKLDQIRNQYYVQHGVTIVPKAATAKPGFSIALNK